MDSIAPFKRVGVRAIKPLRMVSHHDSDAGWSDLSLTEEDKMKVPRNYEEALRRILKLERTLDLVEKKRIVTQSKRLAEGFYLLKGKGVEE